MTNRIKLTNTSVHRLSFPEGAVTGCGKAITHFVHWDTDLKGLGIRLATTSRTKTYFLQHRVKGTGRERNISLGRHGYPVLLPDGKLRTDPFGADDARNKARKFLA